MRLLLDEMISPRIALAAAGDEHSGMIFTFDATMPRTKEAIPDWVEALSALLRANTDDGAMRNRIHHLP